MPRELDQMPDCLCFNLRKASRVMTQFFTAELQGQTLLPTQTPILTVLSMRPGARMADLSEMLGMDRTTLLRNLRPLERDGLVRIGEKGGGGPVQVFLTEEGEAALKKFLPQWRKAQKKAVAVLGEERWAEILDDLDRVATAFDS